MTDNLVIIGGGHGAAQCIVSLRQKKYEGKITLISDEPEIPYQRPPLSKGYLLGDITRDRLAIVRQNAYDGLGVDLRLGRKAESIDRTAKTVTLSNGAVISYDKLIIATGGRARRLPLEGADLEGITAVRTLADIDSFKAHFDAVSDIAIVGGGYIGLEAASAARKMGKNVTLIEVADRLLQRVVAPCVSDFYQRIHAEEGVNIVLNAGVTGYEGDTKVTGVAMKDGNTIKADLVIEGVGMIPNTELAEAAGIATSAKGIMVDSRCRTSDPDIFAIGDVTDHENLFMGERLRLESVQNAVDQAKVAIENALGGTTDYNALPWFWSEQYGLKLQIAGLSSGYDRVSQLGNADERKITFLYMKGNKLIAADCVANTGDFMAAKKLIEAGVELTDNLIKESDTLKDIASKIL